MKIDDTLTVDGFKFYTEKDASLARIEKQKIEYMEARMDYSVPESIRYVYERSIQERLFKTPVGFQYLKQLQSYLLSQPQIAPESVPEIPLYIAFDGELRERTNPARARVKPSENIEKEKTKFTISVILNVLLVLAVMAMFYISVTSEQPNIFNYERALQDKYATWEEELTEREQAIREKELELKINP